MSVLSKFYNKIEFIFCIFSKQNTKVYKYVEEFWFIST